MLPEILTLPGLGWEIQAYGLMLALALALAWVVTLSLARRDRLPPGPVGTAYVLGVGLGLMGARVAWLLQRPGETAEASLLVLRADELAPFAGLMVAGVVGGLHLMRRRVPAVAFYDVAAPAFAAGAMVERLGALLAGMGFGDYAPDLPWAIRFPAGSPAFLEHQRTLPGLLAPGAEQSLPVHPTQIYALLVAGAALGVGLWLRRRRRYSGQVFLGTAITYLLGRALVEEWFRADAGPALLGPLGTGQVSALVLAAALGVVAWSRGKLAARRPGAFRPWEGGRWSPRADPSPSGRAKESSPKAGEATKSPRGGGGGTRPKAASGGQPSGSSSGNKGANKRQKGRRRR